MTPAEFLAARQRLGLTQAGLAEALGLSEAHGMKTIGIYENGRREIPTTVELAMAWLLDQQKRKRK